MKIIELSYHEVYYDPNTDLGGAHYDVVLGRFTKYADAVKFAKGKGVWDTDASVRSVEEKIYIMESLDEALDDKRREILKKLTQEEINLLDLQKWQK